MSSESPDSTPPDPQSNRTHPLVSGLLWFITILMFVLFLWVATQRAGLALSSTPAPLEKKATELPSAPAQVKVDVPEFASFSELEQGSLSRLANAHTIIPERNRETITSYVVEPGDSVFSIALEFDIKPETVLWANEDLLKDNPNDLSIGQTLKIPAVNGVIYKWKSNDTIASVARKFEANAEDILTWPDNDLDLSNPVIPSGTLVMVPGGSRALKTWVVPTFWRANAGAERSINPNCDTSGATAFGSSAFVWPANTRLISGNDYWSGHLGLDVGAAMGSPIYAADSGVVVYSGPISGGYGLMVMIDHGNGFHTLYAHLSQIVVRCGQNVAQGKTIAYSGSTGNSTGAHLHFEIRYMGAFVNPHDYLP